MPRSKYPLFVTPRPNKNGYAVGEINIARIKSFNYEIRYFRIVEIEEIIEDHEVKYVYWGVPVVVVKKE